jgi:NTE family protein
MKLGIALGGGGAKGFSHLGVLKALKEEGIEFDIVTGTSVGALVGAAYAAGTQDALEKASTKISLTDIARLLSPAWSLTGFFSGKNALEFLSDLIKVELIEDLSKPYAAVAVDMTQNEMVVFRQGNLKRAIRSSIAIPVLFTPVCEGDKVLVDGGLLEPVPVQLARNLGAEIVVAVDLFGTYPPDPSSISKEKSVNEKLWPKGIKSALSYLGDISSSVTKRFQSQHTSHNIKNAIDVLEATLAISQYQLTQLRLREHPADVLIKPDVAHVGMLDFHRGEPIVEIGYQAGKDAAEHISKALKNS